MANRKNLPSGAIPDPSSLPPCEQQELSHLCPHPKEQLQKKEIFPSLSASSNPVPSPPSLDRNWSQWVIGGVFCLLLVLLVAEGLWGSEGMKASWKRQQGDFEGRMKLKQEQAGKGRGEGKLKMSKEGKKGQKGQKGTMRVNGNPLYIQRTAPAPAPAPLTPYFAAESGPAKNPVPSGHSLSQPVSYQPPMNANVHPRQQTDNLSYNPPLILDQRKSHSSPPSPSLPLPSNFPPFPPFQIAHSSDDPQSLPKADINPMILPFISSSITDLNNPLNAYAGIQQTQLTQAAQFRTLLDDPPPISADSIVSSQLEYYESRYNISAYAELPFCLVVPTFNNAPNERYLRNIRSILQQEYANFHVVIIDDHSEDETGELIKTVLQSQKSLPPERYTLIINQERKRAMGNIRTAAVSHCGPKEIFMIIDGDDELIGRQVLKLFNAVFQEKGLYFVYSNFLGMDGTLGFSRPFPPTVIRNNGYRNYSFLTSHLRAFYTKLLINIAEQDLKDDEGEYLKAGNDVAICMPILEQAHERVGYLPEVTYYYNSATGINNHEVRLGEQRGNDRRVREKKPYKRVEGLE